ncbi:hypothetical protein NDU88_006061 [Pleurodeles waltl]|uniref:Uncharacterized protein n=1 Tax=Pleurodeles waltl TaxID=8319 RepID=A0AAV7NSC5_PLEWA|nr:hypothetical protein NDU88_006061 [Pleurodeles waltl]
MSSRPHMSGDIKQGTTRQGLKRYTTLRLAAVSFGKIQPRPREQRESLENRSDAGVLPAGLERCRPEGEPEPR